MKDVPCGIDGLAYQRRFLTRHAYAEGTERLSSPRCACRMLTHPSKMEALADLLFETHKLLIFLCEPWIHQMITLTILVLARLEFPEISVEYDWID